MRNIFEVNNRNTRRCSGVFIVHFKYCLTHCSSAFYWIWTHKRQMEYFIALSWIHWCIPESDLGALSHLIQSSIYVTTVNKGFQPFTFFCHKELHLGCFIGLELNIVTWSIKSLNGTRALPTSCSSATLGKYEKLTLLDALKIHFQRFYALN